MIIIEKVVVIEHFFFNNYSVTLPSRQCIFDRSLRISVLQLILASSSTIICFKTLFAESKYFVATDAISLLLFADYDHKKLENQYKVVEYPSHQFR